MARFTDEEILSAARVQAGMFVDQHFATVPKTMQAMLASVPSKPYRRALCEALFGALIERLTESRDETLAALDAAEKAPSLWPGGHAHAPDAACAEGAFGRITA